MSRSDNVLRMQITLINIMADLWGIDYTKLSEILRKYSILEYIDTGYEYFNSMGEKGILEDLENFIEIQGGTLHD